MTAAWTWTYLDAEGKPVPGGDLDAAASPVFPSQSDAESWLGGEWRSLAESGVESVTLRCDGADIYGPMSLRPAQ